LGINDSGVRIPASRSLSWGYLGIKKTQFKEEAGREGVGDGGRNDPNIVCTYELKKNRKKQA
jgi:hypothetical protein